MSVDGSVRSESFEGNMMGEDEASKLCKSLMNIGAAISSSSITSSRPKTHPEMRDAFVYDSPLRVFKSDEIWRNKRNFSVYLVEVINHLFLITILALYFEMIVSEIERGELLLNWNPRTNYHGVKCNTSHPNLLTNLEDKIRFDRIIAASESIKNSADYCLVSTGSSLLPTDLVIFAFLGYFCVGIYIGKKSIRINFLSFIFNPECERDMAEEEIKVIFDELIRQIDNNVNNSALRFDSSDNNHESIFKREIMENCPRRESKIDLSSIDDCEKIKSRYKSVYKRLLAEMRLLNLVKPSNLEEEFRIRISKLYVKVLSSLCFMGAFSCFCIIPLFYIYEETFARVSTRLNYYNCQPDTPLTGYFNINLLEKLSHQDEALFLSYDPLRPEAGLYFRLMLIETKYYLFNNNNILKYVVAMTSGTYMNLVVWYYAVLFLFIHIDKLAWIKQMMGQIEDCIEQLNYLSQAPEHIKAKAPHDGESNMRLYRSITVAYVNFELFRRRYKNFRLMACYLILQILILAIPSFYSIFFLSTTLRMGSTMIFTLILSYIFAYLNAYMLTTAMLIHRMEQLRILIFKLVAYSFSSNFKYCHIMDSWLRQLGSPDDLYQLFAIGCQRFYFNYRNVLGINGYIMALFFLLSMNQR